MATSAFDVEKHAVHEKTFARSVFANNRGQRNRSLQRLQELLRLLCQAKLGVFPFTLERNEGYALYERDDHQPLPTFPSPIAPLLRSQCHVLVPMHEHHNALPD